MAICQNIIFAFKTWTQIKYISCSDSSTFQSSYQRKPTVPGTCTDSPPWHLEQRLEESDYTTLLCITQSCGIFRNNHCQNLCGKYNILQWVVCATLHAERNIFVLSFCQHEFSVDITDGNSTTLSQPHL